MLEIKLTDPDCFLKIKETLTRMGIANGQEHKLYQSCHIIFRRGKYYIAHFKELLESDGNTVDISDEDLDRRDDITHLLAEWKLCTIVRDFPRVGNNFFKVIPHRNKGDWELISKYQF